MSTDLEAVRTLFRETVLHVTAKYYTSEQTTVWASRAEQTDRWEQKLKEQHFLVAEINQKIIGFASLTTEGYLDLLYIHKDFQRQGVATQLLENLKATAKASKLGVLSSDVSISARPFFEKHGFRVLCEQTVFIGNVSLMNYKMEFLL